MSDRIRRIAMITVCLMGFIGVFSLCATLFFRNYADPAVLTAIISITSGVVGSLTAILRPQQQQAEAPPPVNGRKLDLSSMGGS